MQDFPDKSPPAFLRPFGSKRQSRAIAVPIPNGTLTFDELLDEAIDGKVYKSKKKFLEAIKDFNP